MKKELLKKLKYDMPKDEEPMMEIELGMEESPEGEEEQMVEKEGPSSDLSMFSVEELQAELDKRKMPEGEEEEPELEELV